MKITLNDKINAIVEQDYRTAAIFKANGIDFCCRAQRTLEDAIREKGLCESDIVNELNLIDSAEKAYHPDCDLMSLDMMIDQIIENHHQYVRLQIPVITGYLNQIFKAHGKDEPVLADIKSLFAESSRQLLVQVETEESILFPMITNLLSAPPEVVSSGCVPLNFFQQMISSTVQAHVNEEKRWEKITELTHDYKLRFGCNVSHVAFSLLREFRDNLHFHFDLETRILFPAVLKLKTDKINLLRSQILS